MDSNKALVVFSGGQDSTTCLFWAKEKFSEIEAVFFDYGQRHIIELESAQNIAQKFNIPLTILPVKTFAAIGGNSLLDTEMEIDQETDELPNSFVPGRNLIFMTYAAALAWKKGIQHLVTGVCQTDYSGYPDCRLDTMKSLEKTINLGMEADFKIHTPLMHLTKAETVELAAQLEGAMEALAWSHTCYEGQYPPCGQCPACQLRAKGFAEAGYKDPIFNRDQSEV